MVMLAVLRALVGFGFSIVPQVRLHLSAWEKVAQTFPIRCETASRIAAIAEAARGEVRRLPLRRRHEAPVHLPMQ